jgi:2-dehydropantoate 2-reductase
MKVAVVGAGGVGSYYGGLLARAGHEVWFHMRRDLAAVQASGLHIRSHRGDFDLANVNAVASPGDIGPADLVICSLKTPALPVARSLVEPSVGPETRLLLLMNGFGIEEQFAEWFPAERIYGGMAFVCINRGQPGTIHHLDYGTLTVGSLVQAPVALGQLCGILADAGMEVVQAPDLRHARWEKLCWNVPFSGLGVACRGVGTATVLGTPHLREMARESIHDLARAANADLDALGHASRIDAAAMVESMFTRTATMDDYRASMVIDFVTGAEIENETILGAPVARARELGVPIPTVVAIDAMVRVALGLRAGTVRPYTAENVVPGLAAEG